MVFRRGLQVADESIHGGWSISPASSCDKDIVASMYGKLKVKLATRTAMGLSASNQKNPTPGLPSRMT